MPVKHAILGILKEAPRHGYELKSIFDARIGNFWNLNYGQIYTTLDRLDKEGLVSGTEEEQSFRPDKKVYDISPQGVRELERWLQEPATKPRALRDELFIKLVFISRENPELALQLLERQTQIYMEQMRELTETKYRLSKGGINRENMMTDLLTDAALYHAEADVRWLSHVEAKILEYAKT
ncbi:PadR family transcriptional regulator [Desulfosporosinus shakirovi]|uniref:PadR family transcriptional regulator n=1 Tax=Desulfosporosinus shakirovi TaxID=2885154 RepID=UPI001E549D80|nr:PadR family transcriptional regulator [Desulfosporosinus sp. SRJS8]MCB8815455.1 PadR family transcriptional regulator [Desulfosporosinus sp. SRJS8]